MLFGFLEGFRDLLCRRTGTHDRRRCRRYGGGGEGQCIWVQMHVHHCGNSARAFVWGSGRRRPLLFRKRETKRSKAGSDCIGGRRLAAAAAARGVRWAGGGGSGGRKWRADQVTTTITTPPSTTLGMRTVVAFCLFLHALHGGGRSHFHREGRRGGASGRGGKRGSGGERGGTTPRVVGVFSRRLRIVFGRAIRRRWCPS